MKPPRDPFLRAIYRVCRVEGLRPTEKLAMLALWRYLGGDRKSIGPSLLAELIGTTRGYAKNLLARLRSHGFIGSTGKRSKGTGKVAVRWLTGKIKWPLLKGKGAPHGASNPIPGGIGKRVPGGICDQGVRHPGPPPGGSAAPPEKHQNPEPLVPILDILDSGRTDGGTSDG